MIEHFETVEILSFIHINNNLFKSDKELISVILVYLYNISDILESTLIEVELKFCEFVIILSIGLI
jgi:hypothetical protein